MPALANMADYTLALTEKERGAEMVSNGDGVKALGSCFGKIELWSGHQSRPRLQKKSKRVQFGHENLLTSVTCEVTIEL
jgi:hypothetical protein